MGIAMSLFGDIPIYEERWNTLKKRTEEIAQGNYPEYISYTYGQYNVFNNFGSFPFAFVTLLKVATLDDWSWLMHDMMESYWYVWMYFFFYLVIISFLFLNIFTAIVMDQYEFTSRVTSAPYENGLERQILTFDQASAIAEEWSYLDPNKTQFVRADKVRNLFRSIPAPIGYPGDQKDSSAKARELRHLRRMELRMTEDGRVSYVDLFLSCVILRYRQQRKPIIDLSMERVEGKTTLLIQRYFPTIKDPELQFTTGMVSAYYALTFLQSHYLGLQLRRMRKKGDVDALQNYSKNREDAKAAQEIKRAKEDAINDKAQAKGKKEKKKKKGGKK